MQSYYPSVALSAVSGTLATAAYLGFGIGAMRVEWQLWLLLWSVSMGSWALLWLWLRRFNLAEHERRELGVHGMLLALFAVPVYVVAGVAALLRRPLAYAVTAKGRLASADGPRSFRLHAAWAGLSAALLGVGVWLGHRSGALWLWSALSIVAGVCPPLIAWVTQLRNRRITEQEADLTQQTGPLVMTVRGKAAVVRESITSTSTIRLSDLPHVPGLDIVVPGPRPAAPPAAPAKEPV